MPSTNLWESYINVQEEEEAGEASNAEGEVHGTAQHGTDRAQTGKTTNPNPRTT